MYFRFFAYQLYMQLLATLTADPRNIGKIVALDPESGDYEIDADILVAAKRLQSRHPQAQLYGERIGYDAVYALGGAIHRVADNGERMEPQA